MGYGVTDPLISTEFHERFKHVAVHKNLSCVVVCPSTGFVDVRVVDAWESILKPPNQKYAKIWVRGMEVGAAYNTLIEMVLGNEELSKWKYIVTIEEDNLPAPRHLFDLLQAIEDNEYDVLGGLYYVKGVAGFPQIWGDPDDPDENYRPMKPRTADEYGDDLIVPCNGTGMGFTAYRMEVFRQIKPPWFETTFDGLAPWTQDLRFFHIAREQGLKLKVGVHCGIRIGHLDVNTGDLW